MRLIRYFTSKIGSADQAVVLVKPAAFACDRGSARSLNRCAKVIMQLLVPLLVGSLVVGGAVSVGAAILPLHAVTFHENDSSLDAVITSQTNNSAAPLSLFSSLSPPLVNPGYTFASWNTSEFGNGIQYLDGSVYNFASGSIDLYAQWSENSV